MPQKCINNPKKSYTGNEPSPKGIGYSASVEDTGTVMKGRDGNNWEIKTNAKQIKRWVKTTKDVNKYPDDESGSESESGSEAEPETRYFDHYPHEFEVDNDEIYTSQIVANINDHMISKYNKRHPCFNMRYVQELSEEMYCDFNKELRKVVSILLFKKNVHPGSDGKVYDLIHPSHYPFIQGVSKGNDGKVFKDPYQAYKTSRRDKCFLNIETMYGDGRKIMDESMRRWLPTVYEYSHGSLTQKSYINDLYGLDKSDHMFVEKVIADFVSYSITLWEDLFSSNEIKLNIKGRDLQIIPKIAYYALKPGQTHEGVWHVEGMPDEHIIANSIYYIQDDFGDCTLSFRRSRTSQEQEDMIMIHEQNAYIMGGAGGDKVNQYLGEIQTDQDNVYSWTNALQHKLEKIENKTNKNKIRTFIALFLVDPDVTIVSTKDIPPQYDEFSDQYTEEQMKQLMTERKGIKMKLNEEMSEDISYCEH